MMILVIIIIVKTKAVIGSTHCWRLGNGVQL